MTNEQEINEVKVYNGNFPTINQTELTMFLQVMQSMAKKAATSGNLEDYHLWIEHIGRESQDNKEFQHLIYNLKQMIHIVNRTAGLMNAYVLGLTIGLFLARPELIPSVEPFKNEMDNEG